MDDPGNDREGGGIKLRKLRIAVSVACAIACVLLIVLWVRSFWWADFFVGNLTSRFGTRITSANARMICWIGETQSAKEYPWRTGPASGVAPLPPGVAGVKAYLQTTVGSRAVGLQAPHWMLCGVGAFLAYASWIRWRFRLRTLLIATPLIAVVLGLVAWAS